MGAGSRATLRPNWSVAFGPFLRWGAATMVHVGEAGQCVGEQLMGVQVEGVTACFMTGENADSTAAVGGCTGTAAVRGSMGSMMGGAVVTVV
mmetsp:Transcript_119786/g.339499  ORF Transcript_119786/g.339499 Transcript_119786/m.339499 type:complete len:92 (-) Transcript_119786:928-1203(-)